MADPGFGGDEVRTEREFVRWAAALAAESEKYQQVSTRVTEAVVHEASRDGLVKVTVGTSGVLRDLEISDQARAHGIGEDEVIEKIMLGPVAVKRLIEPSEVADLVAFLCGPSAASISGSSFTMDGGWTAH